MSMCITELKLNNFNILFVLFLGLQLSFVFTLVLRNTYGTHIYFSILKRKLAQVGLEPTTLCLTTELSNRNMRHA